jgi:NAD+ synthase (glutamine-hydrolysing)
MRLIKVGLANLNSTVGALQSNTNKVIAVAGEMAAARCTVGCFSEQILSGYPCEDLIQWDGYVERQWKELERFAAATQDLPFPSVFIVGLTVNDRGFLYNAAAVVSAGVIRGVVPKEHLPTYGVFYERRTFSQGIPRRLVEINGRVPFGDLVFRFPFGVMAVEVCEDIWVPDGPMLRRSASGAELVLNISASPWRGGVVETRREMIATRAADNQVALVYVNQFGGQDSLVFDGGGYVNQNGRLLLEAERWREGWTDSVIDLERTARLRSENTTWRSNAETYLRNNPPVETLVVEAGPGVNDDGYRYPTPASKSFFLPSAEPPPSPREEWYEDLLQAMKTGLAGYFEKTGAFDRIGIALSGGKDSTLTAIVAWLYARDRFRELAPAAAAKATADFIHCFSMPTRYNSEKTRSLARRLCEELGLGFREISIEEAFEKELAATAAMLGLGEEPTPTTRQNIQARIRAARMWNWANSSRGMWLQSGNMSEKAVGYTTVGGDLMGAYSLLGNLPKTIVILLLDYVGKKYGWTSVRELLGTKASAELAENQEDEKDLMPFPVLDACFALFAGEKLMPADLYLAIREMWSDDELRAMRPDYRPGMLKEWVKRFLRLFLASIFKWVQAPQAVHLGSLDLDRERALQLPVVQSGEWLDLEAIDALPD